MKALFGKIDFRIVGSCSHRRNEVMISFNIYTSAGIIQDPLLSTSTLCGWYSLTLVCSAVYFLMAISFIACSEEFVI